MPGPEVKVNAKIIALAVSWMRGEITTREAKEKLGYTQTSQTVYKMGVALREAWKKGLVK